MAKEPIKPAMAELPDNWQDDVEATRAVFEHFRAEAKSPILTVPSIVIAHGCNHLINPAHPDASAIAVRSATHHPLDRRFLA